MKKGEFPYVQMLFKCQVLDKNGLVHPNPKTIKEFSFGGYVFIVDGKEIPFDWDACSWDFDGSHVIVNTGYGAFFNEFRLSEFCDEELEEIGLTRKELTPKFLSRCERIVEMFCEGGDILIEDIAFIDDKLNTFSVRKDVIEKFNEETKAKY